MFRKLRVKLEASLIEFVISILFWIVHNNSYVVSNGDKKIIKHIMYKLLVIKKNVDTDYLTFDSADGDIIE